MPEEQLNLTPDEAVIVVALAAALEDGRIPRGSPTFTARTASRAMSAEMGAVAGALDRMGVFMRGRGMQPYHRDTAQLAAALELHLPAAEVAALQWEGPEQRLARFREETEGPRPEAADGLDSVGEIHIGGVTFAG